jgi:UDP-N-acetylmuramyl tripeptide synthase
VLSPRMVVVTNFFRDQLDRYGELDTTARRMGEALREHLGADDTLLLNVDDPLVQMLGDGCAAQIVGFGIEAPEAAADTPQHAADTKNCPDCGNEYEYSARHFAHIGKYRCPDCGRARRQPDVAVESVTPLGTDGLDVSLSADGEVLNARVAIAGLYNAYNIVAAVALCRTLGIDGEKIVDGLADFSAAFGRVEAIDFPDGKRALLLLAKNPTGLNEVIRMLRGTDDRRHTVIALNDNIADGRDVSWIWDADLESLAGAPASVIASGIRAHDMALRLKYAGFAAESITLIPDTREALAEALSRAETGETVNVVPTYTALLDLRNRLQREGLAPPFWEE